MVALQILVLSITVRVGIPQQVFVKNILACRITVITLDSGSRNVGSIPAMPTASTISTTVSAPDFQSGHACSIQVLRSLLISYKN